MKRRDVFTVFAAAVVGCGATTLIQPRRYGELTIERHQALCKQGLNLHVFYQGRDVTKRCSFADDTGDGMAELYIRNASGRFYVDPRTDAAAKEIVYGVTFRAGGPFT